MTYTIHLESFYPEYKVKIYDEKNKKNAYKICKELIDKYNWNFYNQPIAKYLISFRKFDDYIYYCDTDIPIPIYNDFDTRIYLILKNESNA